MQADTKHGERYAWIVIPALLAVVAVLGTELAFTTGALGKQYNASVVWDQWDSATFELPTCEEERAHEFIRRPISAVFSVCYFFVAVYMISFSMIDVARSPGYRNLHVLLEREPWWGPVLAAGPLALAALNFLAFASSRQFLFTLVYWVWWCTFGHFAAYAWTRLLQEGLGWRRCFRTKSNEVAELMLIMEINDDDEESKGQKAVKEVILSLTSVICIGSAAGIDFLLFVLKDQIISAGVQDLLLYLLILMGIAPVYFHWRRRRLTLKVRWWHLSLVAVLGTGSYAILQGDFTLALCPTSSAFASLQPYAGFEFLSSLSLIALYHFFRGDRKQARYMVVVQVDHRIDEPGVVSAFMVPEDDPYRSRRGVVANAIPAAPGAPSDIVNRQIRSDSSDSRSSSRRRSSAQVEGVAPNRGITTGRTGPLQSAPFVAASGIPGDRRSTTRDDSTTLFASSARVEGSTSSRTSQESARRSAAQQLKPRPPGTLVRDSSSDNRRVSSTAAAADASARPRVPSIERRLEPRPRSIERTNAGPGNSTRALGGRGSLVDIAGISQLRSQSLERSFLDSQPPSMRGSMTNMTGRPSSGSFDQYSTAPIVSSVPIGQPGRSSNSSSAAADRPRPPSLDASVGSARSNTPGGTQGDIPVIVARSRVSSVEPASNSNRPSPPEPPPFIAGRVAPPMPARPSPPASSATQVIFGPGSLQGSSGPTLASASKPTNKSVGPPPGLGVPVQARRPTGASLDGQPSPVVTPRPSVTPSINRPSISGVATQPRPSVTMEAGQAFMLPVGIPVSGADGRAGSFHSAQGRSPAGSFDSVSGSGRVPGRPSGVVPGRPRRSSVDRDENPTLRVLNSGTGRSVERERDLAGRALDTRKIALRSPEEALEATRRLSVGTFEDEEDNIPPPPQASMSTAERLAALRNERARLEQARKALQQKRNGSMTDM